MTSLNQHDALFLPMLPSLDHAGLAKYVAWHMENGSRNFCLTFTYSQLDFISAEEIAAVTRTVRTPIAYERVAR